jgi:hypothetical protein
VEEVSFHETTSSLGWRIVVDQSSIFFLWSSKLVEISTSFLNKEISSILSNSNSMWRMVDGLIWNSVSLAPSVTSKKMSKKLSVIYSNKK